MTELLDIFDLYGSINKVTGCGLNDRRSILRRDGNFSHRLRLMGG